MKTRYFESRAAWHRSICAAEGFRFYVWILVGFVWIGSSHAESTWISQIEQTIDEPEYQHANWGLLISDADSGDVLYERNGEKLFAPASTTKLYSVAAALDTLGPDYRFETPVYARGQTDTNGVLHGDLILVASGDLTLGGRTDHEGHIAFAGDLTRHARGPAAIDWRPRSAAVSVDAQVPTVASNEDLRIRLNGVSQRSITVRGHIPVGHKPLVRVSEVPDPGSFARTLLIEALRRAQVQVDASPFTRNGSELAPARASYSTLRRVALFRSSPFREELKLILKINHNLHASTLPLLIRTEIRTFYPDPRCRVQEIAALILTVYRAAKGADQELLRLPERSQRRKSIASLRCAFFSA
jgi:D-alanyl-D-alanine carboxypeptidase